MTEKHPRKTGLVRRYRHKEVSERVNFTLGHEMVGRLCFLNFRYAADNNVSITLDATPVVSLPGNATTNFSTLHTHSSSFTGAFGSHTLQATVGNAGGPSGLLIDGSVRCTCERAPPLP